jgi:hypothetical protein
MQHLPKDPIEAKAEDFASCLAVVYIHIKLVCKDNRENLLQSRDFPEMHVIPCYTKKMWRLDMYVVNGMRESLDIIVYMKVQ